MITKIELYSRVSGATLQKGLTIKIIRSDREFYSEPNGYHKKLLSPGKVLKNNKECEIIKLSHSIFT